MDAFGFEDLRSLKNTVCKGTRDVEEGDSRGVQRAEMKADLKLVILPANLPPAISISPKVQKVSHFLTF